MAPLLLLLWTLSFQYENAGKSVPVLCYHNVKTSMTGHDPAFTITPERLREQLQMLRDSGFQSVSPDDYYNHVATGAPLPPKPVMITFDDNHEEQFLLALPLLQHSQYKATFFIMTVTIGKKGYMNEKTLSQLADSGHTIALHTWDHQDVRQLSDASWEKQLDWPIQQLEKITHKPVRHFAYPYGAWDTSAIAQLKKRKILTAYQLWGKTSPGDPLYTLRRILVSGNWTGLQLSRVIRQKYTGI